MKIYDLSNDRIPERVEYFPYFATVALTGLTQDTNRHTIFFEDGIIFGTVDKYEIRNMSTNNGVFIVSRNIVILPNGTLEIQPGVQLYLQADVSIIV